ncbi:MAG: GNAT family N-acetyltransferase [Balneolaceae bacterium]
MSAPSSLTISRLATRHLDEARQLSLDAGWNQTRRDWERLLDLDPMGCIGGFLNGDLIGTVTLVSLGDRVGWIGMMLVSRSCRGNGYGRRLFQEVLREADKRSLQIVGLDATHLGLPLYQSEGFHAVTTLSRWSGSVQPETPSTPDLHSIEKEWTEPVVALDHQFSGVDRRFLIRTLLNEAHTTGVVLVRDGRVRGFAMSRPGERFRHIGPVMADSPEQASLLISELGRRHPDEPVLLDLPDRPDMDRHLLRLGLRPQRRLTRMTRPDPVSILDSPKLPVIVSFEWG